MTGALGATLNYRERIGTTLPGEEEEPPLYEEPRSEPDRAAIQESQAAGSSPQTESAADRAEEKFKARKSKESRKDAAGSGRLLAAFFMAGGTLTLLLVFWQSGPQLILPSRNRLGGISSANVFSDAAVSAPIRPQDMLPRPSSQTLPSTPVGGPSGQATAAPTTSVVSSPSAPPTPVRRVRRAAVNEEAENSTRQVARQAPSNTSAVIFSEEDNDSSVIVPPAEALAPIVVNVGERLVGKLAYPVITGGGAVPATLTVVDDLVAGGRIAVPAGSRLVGQAFATTANDRVQLVVNAVVIDGRTVPMSAVAFDEDNQIGVAGKVLKKGGGLKGAGGHAVSIFSKVLSFGAGQMLPGADGLLGAAAGNAVSEANAGLAQAASQWVLSTKVVEVAAGKRVIIYLAGDLHPLGSAAAPDGLATTEAGGQ